MKKSEEILDAALQYADKGWAVFPISKEKIPLTKNGFKDASTNHEQIKEWFSKYTGANIGIATGQMSGGLVVVDIDYDPDECKDGYETLENWENENACYVESRSVVTGRGGKHLYFTSKEPFGCRVSHPENLNEKFPYIDIRGDGGYVVAPPSIHKNGREYFWDDEDEEIINVQEDSDVEFFLHEIFSNSKKNINGFKEPFKAPSKVENGSRNDTIFKQASKLQGEGWEDQEILDFCKTYNQSSFNPPLDDAELERTVNSALKYEKGTNLKKTKEDLKTEERKKENIKELQMLRKATSLIQENLPDLREYVGVGEEVPFLVEGTCILSAKSKLGKSWLALEMCDAISKGNDFLGFKTRQCSTLYLDLETKKNLKQKRLKKLEKIVGKLSDSYYIQDSAYMLDEGLEEEIENYMKQDPNIGVIVIDVLQKVMKPKKRDVTDYEHYYEKIGILNAIADKYHLSIIMVCHDRKTVDPADPFSNILGSTALQGATDQMIVMFKRTYNDVLTHISVKGRTIDGILDIDAQMNEGMWTIAENVAGIKKCEEYKKTAIYEGIKKILSKTDYWKGRCSQFARDCEAEGIDLKLPLDKSNSPDFRPIGKAFLDITFQDLLQNEGITLKVHNQNSSGGKEYSFTVQTVQEEWVTVQENDGNPWE